MRHHSMYTVQEGRFMLQMSHIGFRPLPVIAVRHLRGVI